MRCSIPLMTSTVLALSMGSAWAQAYPTRPIRLIVPFPAGGTTDTIARPVASQLEAQIQQSVVIDNRSGANGIVGTSLTAKATPDGYTMLWTTTSIVINQALNPAFPLDILKDLQPVALGVIGAGYFVLVNPSLGAHSIKDLIALAKNKAKPLTYGTPGVGNGQHILGEMFNQSAGTHLLHVPYRGVPQQLNALLGNEVNVLFVPPTASLPFVKDGRLRAIAFAGPSRWPFMPELPTVAESGLPDFKPKAGWHGCFLPAGTPAAIVNRVSAEVSKALNTPKLKAAFVNLGYTTVGSTPAEFAAHIESERNSYIDVARKANIVLK
jgi:tripartite-type tricarboxylate transporter receptor subunit TctC